MAGWILGVRREQADNWRIGRDAGRWAIPQYRNIRANDHLFFWLSQSGLVAYGRALTDAEVPDDYDELPWPDRYRTEPGRPHRYSHWFGIQVIKELPSARPQSWTEMARDLGIRGAANRMPIELQAEGDAVALSWFEPGALTVEYGEPLIRRSSTRGSNLIDFFDLATDTLIATSGEPVILDADIRGDALNRHNAAINFLAAQVRDHDFVPSGLSAGFTEKPDLVWLDDEETLYVAEVKGLTASNELSQLRIGLGQVLRYRYRAGLEYANVRAWLVTDTPPVDVLWEQVCASVDVVLWWPGKPWPPTVAVGS